MGREADGRHVWKEGMDGWREPGEGATCENIAMHDDDDDDVDYGDDGDDGACAREMHVQASRVKFKGSILFIRSTCKNTLVLNPT